MPKSNEGTGRFTVTLPLAVIRQLDAIATKRGIKRAGLMREAVLFWLAEAPANQGRAS